MGRFLLRGGETVWEDGPLTRAVRQGGICYLDEMAARASAPLLGVYSATKSAIESLIDALRVEL